MDRAESIPEPVQTPFSFSWINGEPPNGRPPQRLNLLSLWICIPLRCPLCEGPVSALSILHSLSTDAVVRFPLNTLLHSFPLLALFDVAKYAADT